MKFSKRFTVRAALVLAAGGVIGAFGACKKDAAGPPAPPPPPPPPPPSIPAPSALTATAGAGNRIDLSWTDNSTTETGFRVERCSGAGCANFAQIGANTAADIKVFADTFGLAVATSYSYRVRAFNATDASDWSTTASAITGSPPPASPILVGAGEITTCTSSTGPMGTASLVSGMLSDPNVTVFTAGNNVSDADPNALANCFDPKWGSFKSRTYYALGVGDFTGRGADAVYNYFGDRTGPKGKGYYSFDLGTWHIVVLSTSTYELGADELTNAGSAFNQWLVNDLSTTTKACIMAISWERRLFTTGTGTMSRQFNMNTISEELYAAGADVLVSANDKLYARFPQTTPDGATDTAKGFRQFIVGTGGRSFDALHPASGGNPVEIQQNTQWGVIKFTLNASSYKWEFVPTTVGGFTDSGETNCH